MEYVNHIEVLSSIAIQGYLCSHLFLIQIFTPFVPYLSKITLGI